MKAIDIYNKVKQKLKAAGIESAGFEARQLIGHALSVPSARVLTHNIALSNSDIQKINQIVDQRITRYPLQYILGQWSFYSLPFKVGEGVLIPRADTEILVDQALEYLKTRPKARVIDLCSGSGCIAVAIAKNAPDAKIFALEKYPSALDYLTQNIKLNDVDISVIHGDICRPHDQTFDLIVSNPPYIERCQLQSLMPEVQFEPDTALDGGDDGLEFYRIICRLWAKRLNSGGGLMVEVGHQQHRQVQSLFTNAGLQSIQTTKDLNGVTRVVAGFKP